MKPSSAIALVVALGVGAFVYLYNKQLSDVDEVCSLFIEGETMQDLKDIEKNYSLKLMSPSPVNNQSETQQAIYCASLTMCDASCKIEFQNDRVTKVEVARL